MLECREELIPLFSPGTGEIGVRRLQIVLGFCGFFFWELCNPRENKQNNNTKADWILFLFSSCLNNQGLGIPLFPLEG